MLVATAVPAWADAAGWTAPREKVVIETASGTFNIEAEVADTPAERQLGLMDRKTIAPNHGMLFDFDRFEEVGMWMHRTHIPLDMVFLRPDGRVHRVVENTVPHSKKIISSLGRISAVLELKAGTARFIGLKAGDRVRHRIFTEAN